MELNVRTIEIGGHMAVLDTFTTVGPMSVCYPRLNSTLPLENVHVDNGSPAFDSQSLDLVNKVEGLGLDSAVSFLLIKKR